ncbi:hypothetical protein GALL_555320 [mine drainage metagenome]|uniref:Uncharacterized protein n=1 Tax=mine drainage metagenome TaxID=410659 RepID=A0A1J5NW42_9ZZZZ
MAFAAEMLGLEAQAVMPHQFAAAQHVLARHVEAAGPHMRRFSEHAAAAEQLGFVVLGACACGAHVAQEQQHGLVGIASVQRAVRAMMCAPAGQHVVTQAADSQPGMPDRDGHARSEQGAHTGAAFAEINLPRLKEDFQRLLVWQGDALGTKRGVHRGLRYTAGWMGCSGQSRPLRLSE